MTISGRCSAKRSMENIDVYKRQEIDGSHDNGAYHQNKEAAELVPTIVSVSYTHLSNEIQFLLYSLPDKEGKVQVVIKDETIWCTQKAMAELFGIDKSGISRHIANIFKDEELQQDTTVAKIATVVNRGIRRCV